MDLQAQDRAHRIGQTRPVLVYRLVSAHTIETKILQKAGSKRKLEALVISQGKFGRVVDENGRVLLGRGKTKNESVAEMAKALLDLEGEEINVARADDTIIRLVAYFTERAKTALMGRNSDADLNILLDRSAAAFAREKGWSAGLDKAGAQRAEQIKKGEKTAFEVGSFARQVESLVLMRCVGVRAGEGRRCGRAGCDVWRGWRERGGLGWKKGCMAMSRAELEGGYIMFLMRSSYTMHSDVLLHSRLNLRAPYDWFVQTVLGGIHLSAFVQ